MSIPKVLIGIISKNRAKILPKAIDSALGQTYINKEIWVYDDNSSDETFELAEKYPEVNWVFSKEDRGYLFARNMFMQKDGVDYFCSLDDDSWFIENDTLKKAIKLLDENNNIGVLGFDIITPEQPELNREDMPFVTNTNSFIGCGHIINIKAAKEIGYYTPNPGFYGGEEKDLSIRLIDKGYSIVRFNHMYVWHDKTNVARDLSKQHRSGVYNDMVFTWRRTPFIYLLPSLVIKAYKHLKFSITFKKQHLLSPYIKGMLDFISWLIIKKTNRRPVSRQGFWKYLKINKN